jgi:hypothetical protein
MRMNPFVIEQTNRTSGGLVSPSGERIPDSPQSKPKKGNQMEPTLIVTPSGVVVEDPYLEAPDRRHGSPGFYSVKLRLSRADAAPILTEIVEQLAAFLDAKARKGKLAAETARAYASPHPYGQPYQVDGDSITFSFGLSAGSRSGLKRNAAPLVYDARAKVAKDIKVIEGTTARVSFHYQPYGTNLFGSGVKLKLAAVQALSEYKTFTARPVLAHGFTDE